MYLKDVVFGFDLGDTFFHSDSQGNKVVFPRAMEVIARANRSCKAVYVISKVNEEQKKRALEILKRYDVYKITGLAENHVFFCGARYQKGIIARKLGVNCFVDDRPEVMAHMDKSVYKILFNPHPLEVTEFKQEHIQVVHGWTEIERILFNGNIERPQ
jgi:hypothetical protein